MVSGIKKYPQIIPRIPTSAYKKKAPAGLPRSSPLRVIAVPGKVNPFTILKKVNATTPLNNQFERAPILEPIPLTLNGNTSEIINHHSGPRLIAKNAI